MLGLGLDALGSQTLMLANEPSNPKHRLIGPIPEEDPGERFPSIFRGWYPAFWASELRAEKPQKCVVYGREFVLFRQPDSRAVGLIDRCPHRNVPLSGGKTSPDGTIECPYHGWRFSGDGACRGVPGLESVPEGIRAISVPVIELGGLVWVWADPSSLPRANPELPPSAEDPRYTTVRRQVDAPASLYRTAENALDVPHTSILHRGLFRAGARQRVQVTVRRSRQGVVAEYEGERAPKGILARVLGVGLPKSERNMSVEHWDRFLLPATIQVEYRLGAAAHFLITAFARPISVDSTRLYVVASFRTAWPGILVRSLLEPLARFVFRQDQFILATQSDALHRQGAPRYHSTVLDSLGQEIWRLLKAASDAEQRPEAVDASPLTAEAGDPNWMSEKHFELLA
jgi:phenylpropionate dioxygenase-like ring-hydroxylating dioxygenase large terminal subunit